MSNKILVKAKPTLSNNVLIRKEIAVQQLVGGGTKPTFGDMYGAFRGRGTKPGTKVGIDERFRGLAGMAGKVGAMAATAQQTAEAMQGGNIGAPFQAGVTYQGLDPTATMDPKIAEQIEGTRTPTPAPTPNDDAPKIGVQAPDTSNIPPGQRDATTGMMTGAVPQPSNVPPGQRSADGRLVGVETTPAQQLSTSPIVNVPSTSPQAPAPVPASQEPNYNAMANVVNQQQVPPQQVAVQQPQQVPPQQQQQQVPPQQQQVPLPEQSLTQEQMRLNGVTGPPASTVNPLRQGATPPAKGGDNWSGNPYDWQEQQAPAPQPPSQYSVEAAHAALAPQMPRDDAVELLGGMKPQGYASAAGVTNPNDANYAPNKNTDEIVRDGMPNKFKPLRDWDEEEIRNAFVGTLFDKLGPDMVYKMTPHEIGAVSALMYLKLS